MQLGLTQLDERVEALETTQKMTTEADTPRFVFGMLGNQASKTQKTTVAGDDKLLDKKPVETPANTDSSIAGSFFTAQVRVDILK